MKNTAAVHRIEEGKIFLMHIREYSKKDHTERSFWKIKESDFQAENPKGFSLEPGDFVEFSIPTGKTIVSTFMLMIMPLLLFFAGYSLASALGFQGESGKNSAGILFLAGGFTINILIKKFRKKETLPTIEKKVNKESLKPSKCSGCGSCNSCS